MSGLARTAMCLACAAAGLWTHSALAADYLGAEAVLRQAEAGNTNSSAKPPRDEAAIFQSDLKEFKTIQRRFRQRKQPGNGSRCWIVQINCLNKIIGSER